MKPLLNVNDPVEITLAGGLTTGASWSGIDASPEAQYSSAFTATATLIQELTYPSAKGPIFFYANYSDRQIEYISPADGLALRINDGFEQSLALSQSGELPGGTRRARYEFALELAG